MSKLIAINRADAGVSIMEIIDSAFLDKEGKALNPLVVIEREVARYDLSQREPDESGKPTLPPVVVSWRETSRGEIAALDRTYRGAWQDDGRLKVDMGKARDIHRGILRRERQPLLEALDIEYQRADERGDADEKRRVAAAKRALRDAPASPAIDAAKTLDDLKAVGLPRPG